MAEKKVEWLGVRVFRRDWENGGTTYSCSLNDRPWNKDTRQRDESRWISIWHTLRFKQGVEIPHKAIINLRGNEKPTERFVQGQAQVTPVIWVDQYEIVSQPQNQQNDFNQQQGGFNNQQSNQQQNSFGEYGFEQIEEDIPF